MLFHSLSARVPGVDIEQILCGLHEELDSRALERAWQRVAERHDVLRTGFQWEALTNAKVRFQQGTTEFDKFEKARADRNRAALDKSHECVAKLVVGSPPHSEVQTEIRQIRREIKRQRPRSTRQRSTRPRTARA